MHRRYFITAGLLAAAAVAIPGCSRRRALTVPTIDAGRVGQLYAALKVRSVGTADAVYAPLDPAWFLGTFCHELHAHLWKQGLTKAVPERLDCDKFSKIAAEQVIEWNARTRTDEAGPAFGTCAYLSYEQLGVKHMLNTGIVWRGGQNFEVIFWEPQQAIWTPEPTYAFKTLSPDELSYAVIEI